MTDTITTETPNEPLPSQAQEQQAQPDLSELRNEIERLRKHNEILLSEKKTVSQKAKEVEEQARISAEEKAKRDGDYETLLKARESEKEELAKQFEQFKRTISDKERALVSNKIAAKLAIDGDAAEVLQPFILSRVSYEDGEIKVLDDKGEVSKMTLDDLEKEFVKTSKFKYLISGSGASGGGVTGANNRSSASTKTTEALAQARTSGDVTSFLKHKLSGVM